MVLSPSCLRARLLLAWAAAGALGLAASCVNTDFLEGVRCDEDDDCGRRLRCEARRCGGCPDDLVGGDGHCVCPGERLLECRRLAAESPCMAVCDTATEACSVALEHVDGSFTQVAACADAEDDEPCFGVETGDSMCAAGEARVVLERVDPPPVSLVVNCPPPASENSRFECPES